MLTRARYGCALASVLLIVAGCGGSATLPLTTPASGAPAFPAGTVAGWPQALRDAGHSGRSPHPGPQDGAVRWRRELGGRVTAGPVIDPAGTIYAAAGNGTLHALDPLTGKDRWVFNAGAAYGSDLTTSPALLADGTVLWPGPRNRLYVVDRDGTLITTVERAATILSPVVVDAVHFYLVDMSGAVAALTLDGRTARVRWELDLGDTSYGSPVVARDGTLRLTVDQSVVAVQDQGDRGAGLWRFSASDISEVSAGISPEGVTVFGTNDGHVYGLDAGGSLAWTYSLTNLTYSSPGVAADGVAAFGDSNGVVSLVQTSDGTAVRRVQAATTGQRDEASLWSSPVTDVRGDVYYGTRDGHLYGYDPTGKQLFDVRTEGPVYSTGALTDDGGFVVGSEDGALYRVG